MDLNNPQLMVDRLPSREGAAQHQVPRKDFQGAGPELWVCTVRFSGDILEHK